MPADFLECVRKNGKVSTISLPGDKYYHVCVLNGKRYRGEVKKKKAKK